MSFNISVTTEESSGLSGGQVAAIVICVLILVFSFTGFIILVVCLCATKIFLIVLYDIASDSDDMKSPVTLPDIEAQLQDLKLNQEYYTNGGPFKRHDKLLVPKVHVHSDGKSKSFLQPLTGKKAGVTTFSKNNGKNVDEGSKTLDKGKSMVKTERVKDTLKVPTEEATDAKIESSRKDTKKDLAKDKVLQTSPKVSPRKPVKAAPVSKVGKLDKSPRNAEESVTPREKENVDDQSPRKGDKLQLLSRKSFI